MWAASAAAPTGPNQVWQFDFSEYEIPAGGTWRVAGIADYWSKVEFGRADPATITFPEAETLPTS